MKNRIIILILLIASSAAFGQQKAITDTGQEVLLYNDGTWTSIDQEYNDAVSISENSSVFKKSETADFLLKSTRTDLGIWIDTDKWSIGKNEVNSASEYEFQMKNEDLYAMLISERVNIPIETLIDVAVNNARIAAPDIKVIKKEYRNIGHIQVVMMEMEGTIQGMRFVYFGYYFSNNNGSNQVLTYTFKDLYSSYEKEMETFLNGIILQKQ